jgi:hypothetical protein
MGLKLIRVVTALVCMFVVGVVWAAARVVGFGAVAQNVMEPVTLLSQFVSAACYLIGGSFLFASIIKYIEHRRSPLMVPISTVVFLFIGGLLLVLLPFLPLLEKYVD